MLRIFKASTGINGQTDRLNSGGLYKHNKTVTLFLFLILFYFSFFVFSFLKKKADCTELNLCLLRVFQLCSSDGKERNGKSETSIKKKMPKQQIIKTSNSTPKGEFKT